MIETIITDVGGSSRLYTHLGRSKMFLEEEAMPEIALNKKARVRTHTHTDTDK